MKNFYAIVLAVIAIFIFDSCTRRLTDFTVISTKNVPIGEGIQSDFQKGTKRVKGKDTSHQVLSIPLGYPNMKEAIDKAIEQVPGAIGLVDGVVKSSGWTCVFYGQSSYIVEGTPLFPSGFDYERENAGLPRNMNSRETNVSYVPVSAPTSSEGETLMFFHNVKDGENLASIAQMYGVKISDIIKWNKLTDNVINRGMKLTIKIKDK